MCSFGANPRLVPTRIGGVDGVGGIGDGGIGVVGGITGCGGPGEESFVGGDLAK